MRAMDEVVPGVHKIRARFGIVNAYLIRGANVTLIDAGLSGSSKTLLAIARAVSSDGAAIRAVAVTHAHADHIGSLATVAAATGAQVYAGPGDLAAVRAGRPVPSRGGGRLAAIAAFIFEPFLPDQVGGAPGATAAPDRATLPLAAGLQAIHTSGHTPGHVSYLWPEQGGVLFVGDAASAILGRPALSFVNTDVVAARRSLATLAELDFSVACFGHGQVLRSRSAARFRHWLDGQARRSP